VAGLISSALLDHARVFSGVVVGSPAAVATVGKHYATFRNLAGRDPFGLYNGDHGYGSTSSIQ